ncbi:uncharacterized protein LOC135488637 [Lineus longissimus]|uniref:uncharacterized protein LOC135488637 n=1 Tax=Lineus longissimus TaxID=88925 RepID=UPI002B4DD7A2
MAANDQNRSLTTTEKSTSVVSDQSTLDEEGHQDIPLVFQCKECQAIVGDSLSWVCVDRDLRSFTLKSVTDEVVKSPKMLTSCDEYDLGSTYYQLKCKKCGRQLGRMYTTTPRHLDQLRDLYTLLAETVSSYQLGSSESPTDVDGWMATFPSIRDLLEKLHKTQTVVLTLNERISVLEGSAGISTSQYQSDSGSYMNKLAEGSRMGNGKHERREMPIFEHGRLDLSKSEPKNNSPKDDGTVVMPQVGNNSSKRKHSNSEIKKLMNKKSRPGRI